MAKLSKSHREAISAGLIEFHKGKSKKPSLVKRLAGSITNKTNALRRKHKINSAIRSKKRELDKLYLELRNHAPGSAGHVPHLEKINKVARSLKRMRDNRKVMASNGC